MNTLFLRLFLTAVASLVLFACKRETATSAPTQALEKAEIQALPIDAPAPAFPTPILAGGGPGRSFSSSLVSAGQTTNDAKGRPVLRELGGPKALSPSGRTLKNTHVFVVLFPQPGTTGLFARGTNNYHDYLQFDLANDGGLSGRQENQSDVTQKFHAAAGTAMPGQPCLIEFHPLPDERSQMLVNGEEISRISSLQSLNYFASGYRGTGSASHLGELRFYDHLTPEQIQVVLLDLRSYWDLPGGFPIATHTDLRSPAWLTAGSPAAVSGALTLRLAEKLSNSDKNSAFFCGATPATDPRPPTVADPNRLTVIAGQSWLIEPQPGSTSSKLHFSFQTGNLLNIQNLGPNGSFALLHRKDSSAPWTIISTSSPTPDGTVHFVHLPATAGLYTLAIQDGKSFHDTPSSVVIDGTSSSIHTLQPGASFEIFVQNPVPGQLLTLTDAVTHLPWFSGTADQLRIHHRIFRQAETRLIAEFRAAPGYSTKRQELTLKLDPDSPQLYPGLLSQFITTAPPTQPLTSDDFIPKASWPKDHGLVDTDYPAFRTAESIHPPGGPGIRPSYHHIVLPSLSITSDKAKIPNSQSYPRHPGGDLNRPTRISGFIIPIHTGPTRFSLEINRPCSLKLGGKSVASNHAGTLNLDLTVDSLAPISFELIASSPAASLQLECQLLWLLPHESGSKPVPGSALFHPVDAARERALAKVTNHYSNRYTQYSQKVNDANLAPILPGEQPKALEVLPSYADAFLKGITKAGDPTIAHAALSLIRDRMQAFRSGKLHLGRPEVFIGNIRGDDLANFLATQPFLFAIENHPAFQQESLQARSEIVSYLLATISGRSFLSETSWGANDCYGGEHNFAGAIWPCAQFIDSPYAWDASCNLVDSQFRYNPGNGEGLHSDGSIAFHNVNGRQLHFSGYGRDWFTRIGIGRFPNSPWCMTPEQFHRLTGFVLAYEWFLYRDTYSFIINGRHNNHKSPGSSASLNALSLAKLLLSQSSALFAKQDRDQLDALVKRMTQAPHNSIFGHHFLFRNLATVHRRADFFIENKMIAPLSAGNETFAGKFPWNMGFGDCFTALMRHSGEYATLHRNAPNAFMHFASRGNTIPGDLSLWAWAARPGLTQLDAESMGNDRYRSGSGTYAGGVSDGTLGSMGCEWNAKATHHFKFNIFNPDGFASLTTDITATSPKALVPGSTYRTNLNQCAWSGPVTITRQNGQALTIQADSLDKTFSLALDQRYLIQHDGIAYLILPTGSEIEPGKPGTVDLALTTRSPLTPLPGYTPTPDQVALIQQAKLHETRVAKVFHLSINHGTAPKQAQAAYFVKMSAGDKPATDLLQTPPITILQNRPELQALTDTRDATTHAFFRAPGGLEDSSKKPLLATDTPIVLMWHPETKTLTAQDPRAVCTRDISRLPTSAKVSVLGHPATVTFPGQGQPDDRLHGAPVSLDPFK